MQNHIIPCFNKLLNVIDPSFEVTNCIISLNFDFIFNGIEDESETAFCLPAIVTYLTYHLMSIQSLFFNIFIFVDISSFDL